MHHQRMGDTVMPGDQQRRRVKALAPAESSSKPGFPAIIGYKIGMEKGAISKGIFQHAVDGGAASSGKMQKA
jgi:hypothetical protein